MNFESPFDKFPDYPCQGHSSFFRQSFEGLEGPWGCPELHGVNSVRSVSASSFHEKLPFHSDIRLLRYQRFRGLVTS